MACFMPYFIYSGGAYISAGPDFTHLRQNHGPRLGAFHCPLQTLNDVYVAQVETVGLITLAYQ